jgi:replicative DNA helicase
VTSDAAAGLRELVRKTKIPIVALSQLNRNAKDPGKAPDLADLRESGVIEQEANVVVMIHRPLVKEGDNEESLSNDGKFILAKVREGVRGPEPFTFDERTLTFQPRYLKGL